MKDLLFTLAFVGVGTVVICGMAGLIILAGYSAEREMRLEERAKHEAFMASWDRMVSEQEAEWDVVEAERAALGASDLESADRREDA